MALCVGRCESTSSQTATRTGPAGLAGIADEGHRARRAPAGQHPPLHRGEVLRLVDEHVPERARFDATSRARCRRVGVAEAARERRRVGEAAQPEIVDDALGGVERSSPPPLRRRATGRAASTGPSSESASSTSARSASVHGARGDVGVAAAVQQLLLVVARAVTSTPSAPAARNPNRSLTSSAPESTGHMRSSASFTSGRRAEPDAQLLLPTLGRRLAARERARDRSRRGAVSRSKMLVTLSARRVDARARGYARIAAFL